MGSAFCVKNIAEAECATREPVSARKRACPKLLVVGRSLWPSADRGGPSRGFGFCYRLWTLFWGAESGSSFGRRQVACSLGVGLRACAPQVGRTGWLVGWLVGWLAGWADWLAGWLPVGRSVDGLLGVVSWLINYNWADVMSSKLWFRQVLCREPNV